MVQILPAAPKPPSFASDIGQILGGFIQNAGQSYFQSKENQASSEKMNSLLQQLDDPNLTSMQKINIMGQIAQVNPQVAKAMEPSVTKLLEQEGKTSRRNQLLGSLGIEEVGGQQSIPQMTQGEAPNSEMPNQGGIQQAPSPEGQGTPSFDRKDPTTWPDVYLNKLRALRTNPDEKLKAIGEMAENETQRRLLEKKTQLEQQRHEETEKSKERRFSEQQKLDIHKESKEASKKISSEAKTANTRLEAFDRMEEIIDEGKLNNKNTKNFLANMFAGTKLEGLLSSPERAEFQSASLLAYEGLKDMFGVRLSDADLKLASGKVPSPDKSPEANKAIINFWRFFDKMAIEKAKVAREITKENDGYRPIDFEDQVEQKLQERFGDQARKITEEAAKAGESSISGRRTKEVSGTISMISPDGEVFNIPASQVQDAISTGLRLK